jgi:mannose-6-phosphate isomerase-like protein (cupin superfamily)
MIIKKTGLTGTWKENIRGGEGKALAVDYLAPDEMAGVLMATRIALEPSASVGEHLHPETEELYLVLEGQGVGFLDGESFDVGPGDAWLCKAGHTHGLTNSGKAPLAFFAVLTRAEGR